jgi:hypothetical protein
MVEHPAGYVPLLAHLTERLLARIIHESQTRPWDSLLNVL